MQELLGDEKLVYRNKPYYLSNQDIKEMCEIVSQVKSERYIITDESIVYKWKKGQKWFPHNVYDYRKAALSLAELHTMFRNITRSYCPIQFYTHFPNADEKTIKLMMYYFKKSNSEWNEM